MVDLEPLAAHDEDLVRALIEEHAAHPQRSRAKFVLSTWGKRHFVKVMPHEWRRVLQLRAGQAAAKAVAGHG